METKTSLNHENTLAAKPLLGIVKEFRTSQYYGVRIDKRKKGETITIWYRVDIEAENKKYYVGAYADEKHAAYAFNVAFNLLANGKYRIENIVDLQKSDKDFIFTKVRKLMLKRGLINCN
jgi:hypothetical protein